MLGFNTPEMIRGALENFENTTTDAEHRRLVKTLFNPWYPGNTEEQLRALACEFGWWIANIENRGVVENHNVAIHEYCHMQKGDTYITFDPDVRMQEKGWVTAMLDALASDENTVFCCAAREFHHEKWLIDQHGQTIQTRPNGTRVARYRELIAWSMGMYKGEWLACRPRNFAAENPVYGWAEHCERDRMNAAGKTWCQVIDFHDFHMGANQDYTKWKQLSSDKKTTQKFEDWLKCR